MAPEQKKRSRPASTPVSSKKRQKIAATGHEKSGVKKRPVALDALPWNEVEMPDMFEDAEGFFGLEEVEDVEVVRDGSKVQFVCISRQYYERSPLT
jgi:ATP-dependent RNA helicase DDX24/MAK5